ncbi:MAG: hypothetical protein WA191_07235 [Telluria sp.]
MIMNSTKEDLIAERDKLLTIVACAYQIAGAHDAPAHILDVLSDPEAATVEQIESMLSYQPFAHRPGSTGSVAHEPYAIVIDRSYDGEGLTLAVHDGVNYTFSDGDCFDRDGNTLDGYTAEFLTQYQLEQRLRASASQPVQAGPDAGSSE